MRSQTRVSLTRASLLSGLGCSLSELASRLEEDERGLSYAHRFAAWMPGPLGEIPWARIGFDQPAAVPSDELLLAGSRHVIKDLIAGGSTLPSERQGLFVGTTTSGVSSFFAMNQEYRTSGRSVDSLLNPKMQQAYVAHALAEEFGIGGPVYTFSTSCVASSQALVMARDALLMGWIDRAYVLGIDVLNEITLHGFSSLQLIDEEFTRPFTAERKGINLSEAIVGLVLERDGANALLDFPAYACLSEAHHITQPAPEGRLMKQCMEEALALAGLEAEAVRLINPHGTGTQANDAAEMQAIEAIFGDLSRVDASKRLSGHALGASGALEVLISALRLRKLGGGFALKNSFGFGGANLSLVLSQEGMVGA